MGDEKVKCKQMVRTGERWFKRDVQCKHAAKKDGYCGAHHPDAVAAKKAKAEVRQAEKTARWKAKWSAENQKAKDAAEAPTLRAQVASLTIQRDAAEALARERLAMLDARAWAAQSVQDEALAILREWLRAWGSDEIVGTANAMDRARKLVGGVE